MVKELVVGSCPPSSGPETFMVSDLVSLPSSLSPRLCVFQEQQRQVEDPGREVKKVSTDTFL